VQQQKTQHFKGYLSKPIATKKTHTGAVQKGLPMGVGDHGFTELEHERMIGYLVCSFLCSFFCFYLLVEVLVTFLYPALEAWGWVFKDCGKGLMVESILGSGRELVALFI